MIPGSDQLGQQHVSVGGQLLARIVCVGVLAVHPTLDLGELGPLGQQRVSVGGQCRPAVACVGEFEVGTAGYIAIGGECLLRVGALGCIRILAIPPPVSSGFRFTAAPRIT